MKNRIIEILGKNHTTPVEFLLFCHEIRGIYTYKNDIYVLKNGEDVSFSEFELEEQSFMTNQILNGNYKINATLQ